MCRSSRPPSAEVEVCSSVVGRKTDPYCVQFANLPNLLDNKCTFQCAATVAELQCLILNAILVVHTCGAWNKTRQEVWWR